MRILNVETEKRRTGDVGEALAVKFLRKNGYKILRKNYVGLGYEVDIIAENREFVIFVEVKTRSVGKEDAKEPRPASAVTPTKQGKIILAAKWFRGEYFKKRMMRFDIIEVYIDENKKPVKINHLEGAFNANTAKPAFPRE